MQEIRTGRQGAYDLFLRLVFGTKYRRRVLSACAIADLAAIFVKVCRDFGAELKACNRADDRVHLVVTDPPKVAVATRVNGRNGVASRLLREHGPEISGRYKDGVLWSRSCFAGWCAGAPLSTIAASIRNQREAAPPPAPQGRGVRHGN
jgi:putative transposase